MLDWTNGLAFWVDPDRYSYGEHEAEGHVLVCAECFDSAEGPQDLEEEDVVECIESLIEAGEPTECFSCHEDITVDSERAWFVILGQARAQGREEGKRAERARQASKAKKAKAATHSQIGSLTLLKAERAPQPNRRGGSSKTTAVAKCGANQPLK